MTVLVPVAVFVEIALGVKGIDCFADWLGKVVFVASPLLVGVKDGSIITKTIGEFVGLELWLVVGDSVDRDDFVEEGDPVFDADAVREGKEEDVADAVADPVELEYAVEEELDVEVAVVVEVFVEVSEVAELGVCVSLDVYVAREVAEEV